MSITKEEFICSSCKSVISIDNSLTIMKNFDDDEIIEAKKEYTKQYKLYLKENSLLINKLVEFAILANKHNKKFWCNNWEIHEYHNKCTVCVIDNTSWYKFGKSSKLVKEFNIKNKIPVASKTIVHTIKCPICSKVNVTKRAIINLSKE